MSRTGVRIVAVLQARTSSSRLPGKALLPIAGVPSALLAARRAASAGLEVRLATSNDASDDTLARVIADAGFVVHRGPLQDVLSRFVIATSDLQDHDLLIRLTADNVFPDGPFLASLTADFDPDRYDLLATQSPQDGLPYGMSAELLTVATLREASRHATSNNDREHVTPWIRRNRRVARHAGSGGEPWWSRIRCTIDCFLDYQAVSACFDGVADPVGVDWRLLATNLASRTPTKFAARCPFGVDQQGRVHSRLTLGGAQFGMDYGVANRQGRPTDNHLDDLLNLAADSGIVSVDTARAYGDSEQRLGDWLARCNGGRLRVVTKLDVLSSLPADAPRTWVRDAVDASVLRSAHALRTRRLDTLLLHRWSHYGAWGGAAWRRLRELRDEGLVGTLGASVASVDEALAALGDPDVGHLQCPVNLLDPSWRETRWIEAVRARPEVIVHARSVLLQGALVLPPGQWPSIPGLDAAAACAALDSIAERFARASRRQLAIGYVASLPWVHSLVVGVDDERQLAENLATMAATGLRAEDLAVIAGAVPAVPTRLLNPAHWKEHHV